MLTPQAKKGFCLFIYSTFILFIAIVVLKNESISIDDIHFIMIFQAILLIFKRSIEIMILLHY